MRLLRAPNLGQYVYLLRNRQDVCIYFQFQKRSYLVLIVLILPLLTPREHRLVRFGDVRPMAGLTSLGCGFIEQHRLPLHPANALVAPRTRHAGVRALESKIRALIVIEERRLPVFDVMATRAFRACAGELPRMRIRMAIVARFGSRTEHHVFHRRFQVGGLVAVHASRPAVCAQ